MYVSSHLEDDVESEVLCFLLFLFLSLPLLLSLWAVVESFACFVVVCLLFFLVTHCPLLFGHCNVRKCVYLIYTFADLTPEATSMHNNSNCCVGNGQRNVIK